MTRGEQELPACPGKGAADRAASRTRANALAVALAIFLVAAIQSALAKGPNELSELLVSDVRIRGNVEVDTQSIRRKLLSRAGNPFDPKRVNADVHSLMGTGWFSDVFYDCFEDPPGSKKVVIVFTVKESPVLKHVEYRGRNRDSLGRYKISQKEIEELTGLKVGARADATKAYNAATQIQNLYADKGYDLARVKLVEGGRPGDTRVVFEILEGPKHTVGPIDFEGNSFISDAVLHTKIKSRRPILGFGGVFRPETLDKDVQDLVEYYQNQGFEDVRIAPVTRPGSNLGDVRITFVISEGIRYKVRNVMFEGNKKLTEAALRDGILMKSGQTMLDDVKKSDAKNLVNKYYALGCIDTRIMGKQRVTDVPGVVDVIYEIEEGEPYLLGEFKVKGNRRTQDKVVRREALMAGLLPGEVLDLNRVEIFEKRLSGTRLFPGSPGAAPGSKPINWEIVNRRPGDKPYGEGTIIDLRDRGVTRMQNPADPPPSNLEPPGGGLSPLEGGEAGGGPNRPFSPPADTLVPLPEPPPIPPGGPARGRPLGAGEPPGIIPSVPGMNATNIGPDPGDAFPNRSYADVLTSVDESPTGNIMLSFGASGSQGLFGQVSITERNFDLFNPPRSFSDIANGAFRGGGQQFNVNAMVGTLFNQFSISLVEPYLFDLPISAGATGYYRTRIYPDWTEDRGGGRFWLGKLFGPSIYADVAFRAESVDFFGYRVPAPAAYLASSGFSSLFSIKPSLRFDNRNSPFLATSGTYVNAAFEQGWGTFTFPKLDLEARTYFLLGSRPDGSGPRTLELRGAFGIAGADTPVYERYFAGYFGTLRGFNYRGVGPYVLGSNTGGIMQLLGSVEYMFPLTANDKVRQVVFCDFGTVEPNYQITNFRASVGTGLRIILPMFGPLPLAFDLAFPVAKAPGDHVNYFNFAMGMNW